MRTAETLREAVRNFRFTWEDRVFRLGASIGVVPITAENEDVASILSAADSACAAAKEARPQPRPQLRRERHRAHAPAPRDAVGGAHQRGARGGPLRAVPHDDPAAADAPRPARTTSCCCACAMRPAASSSPDNFIAAAERYGITPGIDRWVIENAFRWLVSEADEREKLRAVLDQPVRPEPRRRQVPALRDRPVPAQRPRCHQDLLRDHRDRGGRELLAGEPLHPGAEGARLQVRARRLRHRPVLVRLPQALPGRLT